jgi:hypothetical protein
MTGCPYVEGFRDAVITVKVAARLTFCVKGEDVLVANVLSPLYAAMIVWDPALKIVVGNMAWPEPFRTPVPSMIGPSDKVTVPVGTPPEAVTVAVNVTDWP